MTTTPTLLRPSPRSRPALLVPCVLLGVLACTLAVLALTGQDLDQDALDLLLAVGFAGTTVVVALLHLVRDVCSVPRDERTAWRSTAAYAVLVACCAAALAAGLVVACVVGLLLTSWLDGNFLLGPSTLTAWQTAALHAAAVATGAVVVASGAHTGGDLARWVALTGRNGRRH